MCQQVYGSGNNIQKIYGTCGKPIENHSHFRNDKKAVNGVINLTLDDIPDGGERILNNIIVEDF